MIYLSFTQKILTKVIDCKGVSMVCPVGAEYIAIDPNGSVWAFENEPIFTCEGWYEVPSGELTATLIGAVEPISEEDAINSLLKI